MILSTKFILKYPNSFICCTGDLNLPDIDWNSESIFSYRYPLSINQSVLKLSADCSFSQLVKSPTRNQNILDLFFTNRPNLVNHCYIGPGISDHDIIHTSICCKIRKSPGTQHRLYMWNQADFDQIRHEFSTLSNSFIENYSVDTPVENLWISLRDNLKLILDEFVPSKMVSGICKKPWINRSIKQLRRRKQKCYNLAKRSKSAVHWRDYKLLKKQMQKECRKAYNDYMHQMIYDSYQSGRKKKFFQHVKSLRRDPGGIPMLEKEGKMYSTDLAKANILNEYFYSVFTQDNNAILPDMGNAQYPDMPAIQVDTAGIAKLLGEIDPYKAMGPDGIPPKLLKELANEVAPCMGLMFSASLKQSVLPNDWKTALVTPVFKKGSRNDPCNYRPISLTSVCCKLFEHVVSCLTLKRSVFFQNVSTDSVENVPLNYSYYKLSIILL